MSRTTELTTVNGKQYLVMGDTFFHKDTSTRIANILLNAMNSRIRIRVDYGNTITGKSWGEENYVEGYVGRSGGTVKIPLLVYNNRSFGGGGILDNCIVKISRTDGTVLYEHPAYSPVHNWELATIEYGDMTYGENTYTRYWVKVEGEAVAGFDTEKQAQNWISKRLKFERKQWNGQEQARFLLDKRG